MSTTTLHRLSVLAGFLSGACIIIGKLPIPLPDPRPGETFDFISPLFALLLTVGPYLWQRRESGAFSRIAAVVFMIAMVPTVLHLADILPETVVVISSVLAGIALIWWSVELYGLVGREADSALVEVEA